MAMSLLNYVSLLQDDKMRDDAGSCAWNFFEEKDIH